MPLALKRYLTCLSLVVVLMAIYAALITPWLQTPKRDAPQLAIEPTTNQSVGWWSDLFAETDWQNKPGSVVQREQGTLLFKEIEHLDSGRRVILKPLTMIIPVSQKSDTLVVGDLNASLEVYRNCDLAVIEAPDGAEIEFNEPPDWPSGKTPTVVRGQLLGDIKITGIKPKSSVAPGASRVDWTIRTAHVRIEGRRVWTNHEVEFIAGNSRAIGKDLAIGLKRDLMGSGPTAEGQFGLLDYMELRTIKEVNVSLPPGGLWKDVQLGRPEVAAAHAQTPASVTLRCKGSMVFDFDESRANLTEHVTVDHRFDNDAHSDQFICHELITQFSVPAPGAPPDNQSIMIGPLKLESVDALGIDSVGPRPAQSTVQIVAPNIATEVTAKWLRVKLKPKRHEFFLDSRNGRSSEGARSGMTQIALSYLGNVFRAPDLYYSKQPGSPEPGVMKANGPGEVITAADSPVGAASAKWKSTLTMRPVDASVQLIQLDGMAELKAEQRGHLRSDQIMITLKPAPNVRGNAPANSSSMRVERLDAFGIDQPSKQSPEVMGNVLLGNPTQNIQVKKLHFEFLYTDPVASSPASDQLELADAAGRPMRQWVGPPGGPPSPANPTGNTALHNNVPNAGSSNTASSNSNNPAIATGAGTPPSASPLGSLANTNGNAAIALPAVGKPTITSQPNLVPPVGLPLQISASGTQGPASSATRVLVLGNQLHSKIIMSSPKPWIDSLVITGPVVVSPDGPVTPGAPAWRVAGNEFMLNGGTDEHYELQIVGKNGTPARIAFGDGWIEGPVVRLSQRTGHLWIDQPGTLCVPAEMMSKSNAAPSGGPLPVSPLGAQQGIEWIEPIKVHWDGGMLFNGTTANIRGHINFDGYARSGPDRLLFLKGTCEAIEVRLTESVNLGNPGKTSATIQSITLRDNVDIRTAQTDLQRNRISLEEIILPELTFQVATNTLIGKGPGEIHSQHQATGNSMGQLTAANRTSGTASSKLQGMHLTFRDYMELKLVEKLLDFKGRVEVAVSPIRSLDEFVDLNQMRTLQLEQSLLRGDHIRIYNADDVTRSPTASLAGAAWEMEAKGNVNFETRTESGEMVGRAARVTYVQAKDLVVINGDPQIPAEIRFRPDNTSRYALAVLSLWQGSINTRSFQASGDLKIAGNSQFVPVGGSVPENWKTGSINPSAAPAPATPPTQAPARPRDALNDWFKK